MTNRIKVKSLNMKGYILVADPAECLVILDKPLNRSGLVSQYLWIDYKDMVYMKSKVAVPPPFKYGNATKEFLDLTDSTNSH